MPTSDDPGATQPVDYLIECFYPDGEPVGTYTSLMETWASTNYLRIGHCDAEYRSGTPSALTGDELAATQVAAAGLPDAEPSELLLEIVAACTRIGSEDGPGGFSTIPEPVLEATLTLCPEAPQADIIRSRLGSQG